MRIEMRCPGCRGQLRFTADGPGRGGSALGTRCGGCGVSYRLWGGQLTAVSRPLGDREADEARADQLAG